MMPSRKEWPAVEPSGYHAKNVRKNLSSGVDKHPRFSYNIQL